MNAVASESYRGTEPTLHDVMDILVVMNHKMDGMGMRLDSVENRLDSVEVRLGSVERSVGKLEVAVRDLQEEVGGALRAIDTNSTDILQHDKRIRRLEQVA